MSLTKEQIDDLVARRTRELKSPDTGEESRRIEKDLLSHGIVLEDKFDRKGKLTATEWTKRK